MPQFTTSALKMIWKKMGRKAYRDAFVSSHISNTVASQIAALRSRNKWTQKQLAEKAGMRQSRISALEDPNYENIEVGTLRRLASAFDVALTVRFIPFSELARWSTSVTNNQIAVACFSDDALGAPITTGVPLPSLGFTGNPSIAESASFGWMGSDDVRIGLQ